MTILNSHRMSLFDSFHNPPPPPPETWNDTLFCDKWTAPPHPAPFRTLHTTIYPKDPKIRAVIVGLWKISSLVVEIFLYRLFAPVRVRPRLYPPLPHPPLFSVHYRGSRCVDCGVSPYLTTPFSHPPRSMY